jgi:D-alanyl-D-alanine dipeptidase
MGTNFDFFGKESYTNNQDISIESQNNRKDFIALMDAYNFENYPKEWWHFTLKNEPFPKQYFNFPIK